MYESWDWVENGDHIFLFFLTIETKSDIIKASYWRIARKKHRIAGLTISDSDVTSFGYRTEIKLCDQSLAS